MMKNKFKDYSTWAGVIPLPEKFTDYFMSKYKLGSLNTCIDLWIFEDFNTYTDKRSNLLILIKSRFRRLNPILASMDFLSSSELLSLWVVEHIEKDLHKDNKKYEKSDSEIKNAIRQCVQQGFTYAEIGTYYLEKRFTKDERTRNSE